MHRDDDLKNYEELYFGDSKPEAVHSMVMLEAVTFKVFVHSTFDNNPKDFEVDVWTNLIHEENCTNCWHPIHLDFLFPDPRGFLCFGKSLTVTSVGNFEFTFRMRKKKIQQESSQPNEQPVDSCNNCLPNESKEENPWSWKDAFGCNGTLLVSPPSLYDLWTQGPSFDHIVGALYVGNFITASEADKHQFTHILNVADNLDLVPPKPIVYRKIPISDGACNSIGYPHITESIRFIKDNDNEGNKILLHCRAGIGRAGSIAVAYVFATQPQKSYEECYQLVRSKRFIYPHKDLCTSLYKLFR